MTFRTLMLPMAWALFVLACSASSNETSAPVSPPDAAAVEEDDAVDASAPAARACYLDEDAAKKAVIGAFRLPTVKYAGKCGKKAITDLVACRHLSDADAPNDPHCQALVGEKPCLACIFDDRGAVLSMTTPNVAGCIALVLGETTTTGCAAAFSDMQSCERAGCASCLQKGASRGDLQACAADAETVCSARISMAACDDLSGNADYQKICEPPSPIDDGYLSRLMNFFCGAEGAF